MRRTLLVLVCCLPCLAQDVSAPPDRDSFSFVVFGDRTGGPADGVKVLEAAVEATNHLDPDFTMTVGDMVQGYTGGEQWLVQMREFKNVMEGLKRKWYPVAGNHDVYGGRDNRKEGNVALYKKHFGPLWYSFDYKWAHFLVLFADEKLAFSNPAKNQNFSDEQLAWIGRDLKKTNAKQVYVFLHHPRWTYRGTNWPRVHGMFATDGRVKAVFAGHIHTYRDDGERDGVHYYTLAVTGGGMSTHRFPSQLHHLNHVTVTKKGYSMSVHPVGAVKGANVVYGQEVDRLAALRRGEWITIGGGAETQLHAGVECAVHAVLRNPEEHDVSYELRFQAPGWAVENEFFGGFLRPGETVKQTFRFKTAPFRGGPRIHPRLQAILYNPLKSGLVHPVYHWRDIPLRIRGLPSGPRERNAVLQLDGKSAIRVDAPVDTEEFTLECWVRGDAPRGSRAVIAKTEGSGFGIWWCYRERQLPYGVVGFQRRGYENLEVGGPWDWSRWTHLALCYDGKEVRFFVNGKLQRVHSAPGRRSRNDRPIYIGADPDSRNRPGHPFVGFLDEVRLSSVARYRKSFRPARVHRRDGKTLLLFHFDQRVNGIHPDDSGQDLHGWPTGKPRLVEQER